MHLGCWAHARRGFHEAMQAMPKDKRGPEQLPARFIELIGQMYCVEAEVRRAGLDANALQRRRQEHSAPVLVQIEALLTAHMLTVFPSSLLGKELHYLASQWPKLVCFVDDGRYPLDNNTCENAMRPFAMACPLDPSSSRA